MTDRPAAGGPFRAAEVLRVIVALVLAVGLWVFVADEEANEILVSAPLELRNIPPGLEVVSQSVQTVDIRLRGASRLLRDTPREEFRAGLDLTGELPGERAWFLGAESVEAPSGVEVMRVDPPQVLLALDRTVTAAVRVSPRVLGQPATGFEIHRIEITPPELTVEGPQALLRDVEAVTTEPVSVQGLRESYAQALQIELDPALRPTIRRVDVRLVIGEERESLELQVPVRRTADSVCDIRTPELEAAVLVPKSLAESFAADRGEMLVAEVECAGLEDGSHELAPVLRLGGVAAEEVEVVSLAPATVTVTVGRSRGETNPEDSPR